MASTIVHAFSPHKPDTRRALISWHLALGFLALLSSSYLRQVGAQEAQGDEQNDGWMSLLHHDPMFLPKVETEPAVKRNQVAPLKKDWGDAVLWDEVAEEEMRRKTMKGQWQGLFGHSTMSDTEKLGMILFSGSPQELLSKELKPPAPVCDGSLVTLYASPLYGPGPQVSLGCSSKDLRSHMCFDIGSIAVKPGVSAILFSEANFRGISVVITGNVADQRDEHELFEEPGSIFLCNETVAMPQGSKEVDAAYWQRTCSKTGRTQMCVEDHPLGKDLAVADEFDGGQNLGLFFKEFDTKGRFTQHEGMRVVAKRIDPDPKLHMKTGTEACFYKTFVREAAMGCHPGGSAITQLVKEFFPAYYGIHSPLTYSAKSKHPDRYAADTEHILMENIFYGLRHPSVLIIDPSVMGCYRCGLEIKGYKIWEPEKRAYKIVTETEIRAHLASTNEEEGHRQVMMQAFGSFLGDPRMQTLLLAPFVQKLNRLGQLLQEMHLSNWGAVLQGVNLLLIYGLNPVTNKLQVRVRLVGFGHAIEELGAPKLYAATYYETFNLVAATSRLQKRDAMTRQENARHAAQRTYDERNGHKSWIFTRAGLEEDQLVMVPAKIACGLEEVGKRMGELIYTGSIAMSSCQAQCTLDFCLPREKRAAMSGYEGLKRSDGLGAANGGKAT